MKSTSARGAALAILLASLTSTAWCQSMGQPTLLPTPPLAAAGARQTVSPTAATTDALWGELEKSPVPQIGTGPIQSPVQGPDYMDAMKGGYEGPAPCGVACCPHHYVYANALFMDRSKQGGFVTSVDSATGSQAINFCSQQFASQWFGGFEIGAGWCFGCGCQTNNALELVYWGLFPATETRRAVGTIDTTFDFSALDYNGASADTAFNGAGIHQVSYWFNFNSVEASLVGNSLCGGPFGCGMCGCGSGGSPWGFGYTIGFRYIGLYDRFLFSSDPTGTAISGDPAELNYTVSSNNNLFGFQIGGGLSYAVTQRLTAYTIGKAGVYDNYVTQVHQVYGTAGNAVINTGSFAGQGFVVRSSDNALAVVGQLDLGGRWAINNNWSVNAGYRVLGLAGVAMAETQVRHNQFHNVDGIRDIQANGSFLLHGGYVGAVYCF